MPQKLVGKYKNTRVPLIFQSFTDNVINNNTMKQDVLKLISTYQTPNKINFSEAALTQKNSVKL